MLQKHWEELTLASTPNEVIDEFIKKYRGAYLWFLTKTKDGNVKSESLCICDGYDSDADKFLFNSPSGELTCKLDSDVILQARFPQTGLFTTNSSSPLLLFFNRIPARQYRKAPTRENSHIMDVFSSIMGNGNISTLSFSTLFDAFKPTYLPLRAIDNFTQNPKHPIGFALSKTLGVIKHPFNRDIWILCYLNMPIGEVRGNEIRMKVPTMTQEVIDFFRRIGDKEVRVYDNP